MAALFTGVLLPAVVGLIALSPSWFMPTRLAKI